MRRRAGRGCPCLWFFFLAGLCGRSQGQPQTLVPDCAQTQDPLYQQLVKRLWNQAQYEKDPQVATRLLRRAYELTCRPTLLANIAQLLEEVEHLEDAATVYERFLTGPEGIPVVKVQEIRLRLAAIYERMTEQPLRAGPASAPPSALQEAQRRSAWARHRAAVHLDRFLREPWAGSAEVVKDARDRLARLRPPPKPPTPPPPVPVKLEWQPTDAYVLIDGKPIEGRNGTAEIPLKAGPHGLKAVSPPYYEDLDRSISVTAGMPSVRLVLEPLSPVRLESPRGYAVEVDQRKIAGVAREQRAAEQADLLFLRPGLHHFSATGPRGRLLEARATVRLDHAGRPLQVRILPPGLAGGLTLGTLGLVAGIVGAGLLGGAFAGCSQPDCSTPQGALPVAGYALLSIGTTMLIPGIVWLASNAANRPRRAP